MRRREFIASVGSAAILPRVARGQDNQRTRRIAVINNGSATNRDFLQAVAAFQDALGELGWAKGHIQFDVRWGNGDSIQIGKHVAELVALTPDVILATGTAAMGPLLRATRTVPIVFNNVADPVGAGFVESIARPGGNATGFIQFDYTFCGKWVELLKEIAPNVTRVAVLRDPDITAGIGQFAVIQAMAGPIEIRAIDLRSAEEIERSTNAFARLPNSGLILTASALSAFHRDLIVALAAQHHLPAIYYRRQFAEAGGLISYGYDLFQQFRASAGYVDRILKGEKPADLPVQAPTKYELVVNLKTAKALGLSVPPTLLARADEVIE
jgi:ABC-type uncharacterized transport system substrate-binding protein